MFIVAATVAMHLVISGVETLANETDHFDSISLRAEVYDYGTGSQVAYCINVQMNIFHGSTTDEISAWTKIYHLGTDYNMYSEENHIITCTHGAFTPNKNLGVDPVTVKIFVHEPKNPDGELYVVHTRYRKIGTHQNANSRYFSLVSTCTVYPIKMKQY